MGQTTLLAEEREAGAELVKEFDKLKPVKAAFWLEPSDHEKWYLYIASEEITDANIDEGYREVLRLVREMQTPYLDAFRVKLIGADHTLVRGVLDLQQRYKGGARLGTWYGGSFLGGQSIEGAYFYALPAAPTT